MKSDCPTKGSIYLLLVLLTLALTRIAKGDSVELSNGDHYSGTVLSVSMTHVSLHSDIQGLITLPREKVASITFGPAKPKAALNYSKAVPAQTNAVLVTRPVARLPLVQDPAQTNVVAQVQGQMLAGAAPEAGQKYQQLSAGIMNGSVGVAEIRRQAQETMKAVEEARKDFGPELDDLLDSYLGILQSFIQQSTAQ